MSSTLSGRSDKENQRNLERFSPLLYQLKKSGGGDGQTHSQQNEVVGQQPGCYPYPRGDQRESPKDEIVDEQITIAIKTGKCFEPKKLL
jgi:hypothetical protein